MIRDNNPGAAPADALRAVCSDIDEIRIALMSPSREWSRDDVDDMLRELTMATFKRIDGLAGTAPVDEGAPLRDALMKVRSSVFAIYGRSRWEDSDPEHCHPSSQLGCWRQAIDGIDAVLAAAPAQGEPTWGSLAKWAAEGFDGIDRAAAVAFGPLGVVGEFRRYFEAKAASALPRAAPVDEGAPLREACEVMLQEIVDGLESEHRLHYSNAVRDRSDRQSHTIAATFMAAIGTVQMRANAYLAALAAAPAQGEPPKVRDECCSCPDDLPWHENNCPSRDPRAPAPAERPASAGIDAEIAMRQAAVKVLSPEHNATLKAIHAELLWFRANSLLKWNDGVTAPDERAAWELQKPWCDPKYKKREIAWIRIDGEWRPTVVLDGVPVKVTIDERVGVGPLMECWGPRVPEPGLDAAERPAAIHGELYEVKPADGRTDNSQPEKWWWRAVGTEYENTFPTYDEARAAAERHRAAVLAAAERPQGEPPKESLPDGWRLDSAGRAVHDAARLIVERRGDNVAIEYLEVEIYLAVPQVVMRAALGCVPAPTERAAPTEEQIQAAVLALNYAVCLARDYHRGDEFSAADLAFFEREMFAAAKPLKVNRAAAERPHKLTWNGTEWVAPCGCRYHPDDDNGSHGGAPHVHRCAEHLAAAERPAWSKVGSPEHVEFWAAVNEYAAACGGNTDASSANQRRMDAVVRVEGAAKNWPGFVASLAAAERPQDGPSVDRHDSKKESGR